MAQKLRSQDVMMIFNEKLDQVNMKFDLNKEILFIIDKKLKEIEKTNVKVDIEPLIKFEQENLDLFLKHRKELETISGNYVAKIKEYSKKENSSQLYFYSSIMVLFCFCAAFLSFGLNQYYKSKENERLLLFYAKQNFGLEKFLEDKKLSENYKEWKSAQKYNHNK